MKKLTALLCLVLALVSLSALEADADTETTLWPAYDPETGLWGYITEDGAWGIEARYTEAYHFRDGCAIVDMAEHAHADTPTQGIIDETGTFLVEPEYYVFDFWDAGWECGLIYFVMDDEGAMGWFNIPNRFFSGIHWRECMAWRDTPYVVVDGFDAGSGIAERATGEIVVPLEYAMMGIYDDIENGFLVAECMVHEDAELIEIGKGVVPLPEGVYVDYALSVSDGLVPFCTEDDVQGYLNTAGEIVIEAQYNAGSEFRDGYAKVVLMDGTDAVIDKEGNVVCTGLVDYYGVRAGALWGEDEENSWGLIELDGTVRCWHTLPDWAYYATLHEVSEEGPIWVQYSLGDYDYVWGLMSREGEMLVEPCWMLAEDDLSDDPMGWHAAWYQGKMGYIDGAGNTVLPFIYEEAGHFEGALARVRFDASTEGYINRQGEVVYQWESADDPR